MAIHEPVNKYPLTKQTVCLPGMIKLLFCIKGFIRARKQIRKERKEATKQSSASRQFQGLPLWSLNFSIIVAVLVPLYSIGYYKSVFKNPVLFLSLGLIIEDLIFIQI